MKLAIQSVADKGNAEKERLILKVLGDSDAGEYILIQSGFRDGEVTIGIHHTYWFPYKQVRAGDLVVLYSKTGLENEKRLKTGKTAHFFYWGISEAIWHKEGRAPVLLHAPEWVSKAPDEL